MAVLQIGQILVQQGALTQEQVEHVLSVQRHTHRPFGEMAERLYGISPRAVEDAWVEQYVQNTGVVDLAAVEIEADVLRRLNQRQAWQFHVLPLASVDGVVSVATDAKSLVRAVNFVAHSFEDPVYFQIAERPQLREFLMKHYPVPAHIADFAEKL